MVIHFPTIEAAREHLRSKGFKRKGGYGDWTNGNLRACIREHEGQFALTVWEVE